jgi:DNA-binding transcriptional MerR regulator
MRKTMATLATPQLSGMLNISMNTLTRYAKVYGDYLSETARQKKRGRRWTAGDVEKVILIRRMHQSYTGEEKVIKFLKEWDEDPPKVEAPMQVMDAEQYLEIAVATLEEVKHEKKEIEKLVNTARWNRSDYINLEREVRQDIKRLYHLNEAQNYFCQKVMIKLTGGTARTPKFARMRRVWSEIDVYLNKTIPEAYNKIFDPFEKG